VLVVEDEMTIAFLIEDMLVELGLEVVGPVMQFPKAIELARSEQIDVALVDVNLDGRTSYEIVDILAARGVRTIFVTGYGSGGMEPPYTRYPVLTKPFRLEALKAAIAGQPARR
jgi:CheY-like chemotaxis protein